MRCGAGRLGGYMSAFAHGGAGHGSAQPLVPSGRPLARPPQCRVHGLGARNAPRRDPRGRAFGTTVPIPMVLPQGKSPGPCAWCCVGCVPHLVQHLAPALYEQRGQVTVVATHSILKGEGRTRTSGGARGCVVCVSQGGKVG